MKVVAYYAMHYGMEWLEWSMRSIRPYVDDILVLYSSFPSHGHGTNIPCPDNKGDLHAVANSFDAMWFEIHKSYWEGEHRDKAVQICKQMGADIILVVDHDEIWEPEMLKTCIEYAKDNTYRNYLVHMQHYWRSVGWVCYDEAMPVRLHNLNGAGDVSLPREWGNVHHFGYAQSSPLIGYKWLIHGHLSELRPNWYQRKFLNWQPGDTDVHPTNHDFWNPVEFDAYKLHDLLEGHPYYGLDIIP